MNLNIASGLMTAEQIEDRVTHLCLTRGVNKTSDPVAHLFSEAFAGLLREAELQFPEGDVVSVRSRFALFSIYARVLAERALQAEALTVTNHTVLGDI